MTHTAISTNMQSEPYDIFHAYGHLKIYRKSLKYLSPIQEQKHKFKQEKKKRVFIYVWKNIPIVNVRMARGEDKRRRCGIFIQP